jgi:hypothetical protein
VTSRFPSSLSLFETTETEKNKKKTRLFIDGHFEVILCSCLLEIIIKHFVTFRTIFIDDTFADDTFVNDTLDFEGESQCMNASD